MESGDSFEEFTGYTLGDGADLETDWYLQGNSCASDEANNKSGVGHSIGFDYGSNITFSTDDYFFGWMFCMMPNATDTFANGGYRVLMGTSLGDYKGWKVGGSNFGRNPYGGWMNVAVDPTFTHDYSNGTLPTTQFRYFAAAYVLVNTTLKGRPICADAYRYGRGELIIELGDGTNGYGTFSGISTENDGTSNRWGLLQEIPGGYLWKGLMSFGNATNLCDFRDANVAITIDDTPRTNSAFNRIEVNNASSRVDWLAVNISAPNTSVSGSVLAKGEFEAVDNATINKTSCVFTDMSTFIYQSNSTIADTIYRRCGQVTQGGASLTGCIFDESSAATALVVSAISGVTDNLFNSDGTGHAIDIGNITTTQAITWDNTESGYVGGVAGSPITTGTSGNETILCNVSSGETLTINVAGGASTPSVKNDGTGDVNVVAGQVSFSLTNVVSGSTFTLDGAFTTDTPSGTYNGTGDNVIQMTATIPTSFASSGTVRLYNGSYYEKYTYTGMTGAQLTGVSPTLSQDFDGSNSLLPLVAPTTITTDPYTVLVEASQSFEAMLANQASTTYIPIQFSDTTGSGFSRRISQIEE